MANDILGLEFLCEFGVTLGLACIDGVTVEAALFGVIASFTLLLRPIHNPTSRIATTKTPTPIQNSPRLVGAESTDPETEVDIVEDEGGETAVCIDTG